MRWTRLQQTGAVPMERSSHSVTIIGDKAYLFGGEHDPRVPVGSELYEYSFADGSWRVVEAKGEPPSPRVAHSAGAVGSVLYIFGGRSGLEMGEGASNDLHAFDTASGSWSLVQPQGPPPPKRSYHTMAVVGPKLYVFGGCGEQGRMSDLHEYDTTTNTWRPLAAPSPDAVPGRGGSCLVPAAASHRGAAAAAAAAAATAAAGGSKGGGPSSAALYVVAGFCGRELDDMHVYSIADNAWCGAACPSCSTTSHPATHDNNTKCGNDDSAAHAHEHDHSHGHHAPAPPAAAAAAATGKLSARSVFGASVHECDRGDCEHRGALLAYGGEVDPSDKGHDGAGDFCASLMATQPAADATTGISSGGGSGGWRSLEAGGDSPGPRGWFAAATTADGRLLVHGGLDGENQRLGDMYVLDVHAN